MVRKIGKAMKENLRPIGYLRTSMQLFDIYLFFFPSEAHFKAVSFNEITLDIPCLSTFPFLIVQ